MGQNQVASKGLGEEQVDVIEGDFLHVQPGDVLGLWEPGATSHLLEPAGLPYDTGQVYVNIEVVFNSSIS